MSMPFGDKEYNKIEKERKKRLMTKKEFALDILKLSQRTIESAYKRGVISFRCYKQIQENLKKSSI